MQPYKKHDSLNRLDVGKFKVLSDDQIREQEEKDNTSMYDKKATWKLLEQQKPPKDKDELVKYL